MDMDHDSRAPASASGWTPPGVAPDVEDPLSADSPPADDVGTPARRNQNPLFSRLHHLVYGLMSDLSGPEIKALLVYLRHAGDDGVGWPSVDTVARCMGVTRRNAERAIAALEARGVLLTIHPGGGRATGSRALGRSARRRIVILRTPAHGAGVVTNSRQRQTPAQGAGVHAEPNPGANQREPRRTAPANPGANSTDTPAPCAGGTSHRTSQRTPQRTSHSLGSAGQASERELPAGLRTEEFRKGWGRWLDYNREKGHALTPTEQDVDLEWCQARGPERALVAIKYIIACRHTRLEEPPPSRGSNIASGRPFCRPSAQERGQYAAPPRSLRNLLEQGMPPADGATPADSVAAGPRRHWNVRRPSAAERGQFPEPRREIPEVPDLPGDVPDGAAAG